MKNYFNLSLTETVVCDFVRDHNTSLHWFAKANEYLVNLDLKGMSPERSLTESESKVVLEFYSNICALHAELEESFTNMNISYYAFKEAAQTNQAVLTEFNKLPADFSGLQKALDDILVGYVEAEAFLKKLM